MGKVFIDNQGNFTHQGEMIAGQDMKIRARDHLDNGGRIRSGSHLDIRSASLGNQKNGELAAGVDYDGKLTSQGDFILHSKGNVTSH
ncbi:hypothetical protein ID855_21235, partial [Xenorhabdus sp. ZM]|uniref:hypothetical protein n=1 Tax=Xenorhabdus szentirmaii TaxID=290112 RepID=UPI0019AF3D41|nr:hypothetical protein [Xenorhabdus sp. ZM]